LASRLQRNHQTFSDSSSIFLVEIASRVTPTWATPVQHQIIKLKRAGNVYPKSRERKEG
jgi:hypothetical protein